jgi:HSP20 family protein
VLAELPGVEKRDIRLKATDHSLTINVDNPTRKYYKELEFPEEVDEKTAKSTYTNGVLEIVFKKKRRNDAGTEIRIG